MKKLTSMTDFVMENVQKEGYERFEKDLALIYNYATFLKQPLKLEMFVPCVDGVPIEYYDMPKSGGKYCSVGSEVEKQAKEKVLFDLGKVEVIQNQKRYFEIRVSFPDENYSEIVSISEDYTVEELLTFMVDFDWFLTENALKQIGL